MIEVSNASTGEKLGEVIGSVRFTPDEPSPPTKAWWKSRTLWFNVMVAMLAAAETVFGVLQPIFGGKSFAALTFALTVGNAGLRVITTMGLRL